MSNINVSIIDQQVRQVAQRLASHLHGDDQKQRAAAFVLLCVKTLLGLDEKEALSCLTEGAQDAGIDALHMGDPQEGEFLITLFQGKYKQRMDGEAAFPAGEINKMIRTIQILFDPDKQFHAHPALQQRVEEIRSLVRDGYLPSVRVVLCNNGKPWGADGDVFIDESGFSPEQVSWEHLNPDRLVELMRPQAAVNADLKLTGRILVEGFDYRRVLVGRLPVSEVARLFERHGDQLLEKNIRRYLGYKENRVNRDMARTLRADSERGNFYFFNNGITVVCNKFRHNELQESNHILRVEGMQVINGGQTCHTIHRVVRANPNVDFEKTFVLLRLYEMEAREDDLIQAITYATNSQNPVELRDLRANDLVQQRLEMGLADLGWDYRRKRGNPRKSGQSLHPGDVAEAVLAVWRRQPHLSRFDKNRHFGNLYEHIFTNDLAPAQVVVAVSILEKVEERRKQADDTAPRFLPYAAHFLAMLIGEELLRTLKIELAQLDHLALAGAQEYLAGFDALYQRALLKLRIALRLLAVNESRDSLQKLSATFRRGDLLAELARVDDVVAEQRPVLEAKLAAREPLVRRKSEAYDRGKRLFEQVEGQPDMAPDADEALLRQAREYLSVIRQLEQELSEHAPFDDQLLDWMRQLAEDSRD